ncbi:MAG TPA: Ldh family oxidoreductase [Bacteroidales bacterium]|nr:Ldh family oxidoreductase [Bacteroidales bacterium]HOK98242.1 Ldh family oxidoreductase [Bacteroidales bacterium]HPO65798.1 Ldh family oxidoreductase [Bacteroidales bacterium]
MDITFFRPQSEINSIFAESKKNITMYTADYLKSFVQRVFVQMGCPEDDAAIIADVFIKAELRGLPSHGMLRLKDYFQLWQARRINVRPQIKVVHETPSTAVVDGDNAVGMVAAYRSMQIAMEKARQVGTGWVATRNSNHYGIAGYYAMMALQEDMIGISVTNANPLVAPTFSIQRMLGTNPLAVAIPAGKYRPFVADFSSTPISRGKLAVMEKKGQSCDLGYVQDKDGNPSTDPGILSKGGSMLTLGGDYEHGSHKGFCMAATIDIFSAVLSGANFGPFVPPSVAYLPVLEQKVGEGTGHFFGAMRIDAFQPADHFKAKMDQWIETFKNAKPVPGKKVIIPGEPEFDNEERIARQGIELVPAIATDVKEIADFFGIPFEV